MVEFRIVTTAANSIEISLTYDWEKVPDPDEKHSVFKWAFEINGFINTWAGRALYMRCMPLGDEQWDRIKEWLGNHKARAIFPDLESEVKDLEQQVLERVSRIESA